MEPIRADHRDFVSSLAKGISVIRTFGKDSESLSLTEVAKRTGMNRAGARRLLLTLESLGYVGRDRDRFFLTSKILDLGFGYLSSTQWWDVATPHMECVAETVNQSCSAALLQGGEIVYAARVPAARIMSVALNLGARLPAYCTSMGRVLLASLPQDEALAILERSNRVAHTSKSLTEIDALMRELDAVRQQQYSFVDQELEQGLRSIAVPLTTRRGRTLAALNVSGHASSCSVSTMTTNYLKALRDAAEQIKAQLH